MYSDDATPTVLRLGDYVSAGDSYYVGRRTELFRARGRLHTHDDFAELTWIESGALQHVVNGTRQVLEAGDLVFIRSDDIHLFRPVAGQRFAQVSVSFPAETIRALEARYFDGADWAWSAGLLPTIHRLGSVRIQRLTELAAMLVAGPASRLQLERFLLELLCDLIRQPAQSALPPWLTEAINQLNGDPVALSKGVTGLAELAGRSREHVNRVIREGSGQTATATVNHLRLTRAAASLRMTDRPIANIAMDCGFPTLSHFYRLFRARFAVTPRQYRMASTVSGHLPTGVHPVPIPDANPPSAPDEDPNEQLPPRLMDGDAAAMKTTASDCPKRSSS